MLDEKFILGIGRRGRGLPRTKNLVGNASVVRSWARRKVADATGRRRKKQCFVVATISKRKSLNEIDAGETESERRVLLSHPTGEEKKCPFRLGIKERGEFLLVQRSNLGKVKEFRE